MTDYRYDAFISYRRQAPDQSFARQLLTDLEAEGFRVAIDERDFRPNESFLGEMERCVKESRFTFAVLSPHYLDSGNCEEEAIICKVLDMQERKHRLVPLVLQQVERPIWLYNITGINFADDTPLVPPFSRLLELLGKEVTHNKRPQRYSSTSAAVFTIPFPRNLFFTGREKLITDLRNQLTGSGTAALSQPAALSGLGGIGKTQTAIEYAYRYQDTYDAVFWVRAETEEELISGFVALADELQLPERTQQDQQVVVDAMKRWIMDHDNWLLIFDNADELNLLRPYWPKKRRGHILITTRAQAIGTFGKRVELRQMEPDEGATFLLRRARIILEEQSLDDASDLDQRGAREITNRLDGLPLALDQAGAFIEEMMISLDDYQEQYKQEGITLLEDRGELAGDHDPVTITFSLAFKKVSGRDAAAADLLRVCAFLAPDIISDEIFIEGHKAFNDPLAEATKGSVALTRTIAAAAKFSLVYRNAKAKTLDMHRLVQEVLREEMDKEERKKWANRAMEAVNSAFPDVEFENWKTCDRLFTHATTVLNWQKQYQIESESIARLLNQTGSYFQERGRYSEAEPLYQHALAMRQRLLGEEHPHVAQSLNNLANLYWYQGRYSEAEPLYKQSLAMDKRLLGAEHPHVANSLNNLANLYYQQGRYKEAEPLYQQALAMRQKLLGAEHPHVAQSLNNLANLYSNQERYREAEPLLKQSLAMRQRLLSGEHPHVASNLNDLAILYSNQGRYREAELFLQQSLQMNQRLLGGEHPHVARNLNNLALLYSNQGRYREAELFLQQSLQMSQRLLGEEHPDVALSSWWLAYSNQNQGKYTDAEAFYLKALNIFVLSLGSEHPRTQNCLNYFYDLIRTVVEAGQADILSDDLMTQEALQQVQGDG